jgi:excisionase family DNA binding protein
MNENLSPQRKTLSVEEAAEALGIGRTLAYEAVRRGDIPTIRIGRRLLVPRGALDQLLSPTETNGDRYPVEHTAELRRPHIPEAGR